MSSDPLLLPPGWLVRRDGPVTEATVRGGPGGVRPRLEWRPGPPPAYDDVALEEVEDLDLWGHRVRYRRFGHRVRGVEVVSEEWRWGEGSEGHVLTGTVLREDYLAVCDLFEEVACSVDLPSG